MWVALRVFVLFLMFGVTRQGLSDSVCVSSGRVINCVYSGRALTLKSEEANVSTHGARVSTSQASLIDSSLTLPPERSAWVAHGKVGPACCLPCRD